MSSVREGVFIATSSVDRRVLGYNRFRVIEHPDRVDIFSRQVLFEGPLQLVFAHHHLDPDWTLRRVDMQGGGFAAGFQFSDDSAKMELRREYDSERVSVQIPVARSRALVLLSPLCCTMVHVLQRYDLTNPAPQSFAVLPSGTCLVRPADPFSGIGGYRSVLDMQISAPGFERLWRLIVDERKNLLACDVEEEQMSIHFRATLPSA